GPSRRVICRTKRATTVATSEGHPRPSSLQGERSSGGATIETLGYERHVVNGTTDNSLDLVENRVETILKAARTEPECLCAREKRSPSARMASHQSFSK